MNSITVKILKHTILMVSAFSSHSVIPASPVTYCMSYTITNPHKTFKNTFFKYTPITTATAATLTTIRIEV